MDQFNKCDNLAGVWLLQKNFPWYFPKTNRIHFCTIFNPFLLIIARNWKFSQKSRFSHEGCYALWAGKFAEHPGAKHITHTFRPLQVFVYCCGKYIYCFQYIIWESTFDKPLSWLCFVKGKGYWVKCFSRGFPFDLIIFSFHHNVSSILFSEKGIVYLVPALFALLFINFFKLKISNNFFYVLILFYIEGAGTGAVQ